MKTYDSPVKIGFKGGWRDKIEGGDTHFYNFFQTIGTRHFEFCDCVSGSTNPAAYTDCVNCAGRGMPPIPWRDLNE
jgi:hypothetical protein